ncbi:MAG: response regulator transcription factor [Candidatus Aminicenantaceae bacterium]
MKRILIIEDDMALAETLKAALEVENYEVAHAGSGDEGLRLATRDESDLILLDLMLPHLTGFEVCRMLREKGVMTPVIFMTGEKKEEIDKVLGLELGGDDYITKPFGIRELLARIKAVIRRSQQSLPQLEKYVFGDVRLDFKKQSALKGEEELRLTAKEFGLLHLLIQNEGGVVTRDTILNEVWGYDKFPVTRTVDTFIHGLRKKIEKDPAQPLHLLTAHGIGYRFVKEPTK